VVLHKTRTRTVTKKEKKKREIIEYTSGKEQKKNVPLVTPMQNKKKFKAPLDFFPPVCCNTIFCACIAKKKEFTKTPFCFFTQCHVSPFVDEPTLVG